MNGSIPRSDWLIARAIGLREVGPIQQDYARRYALHILGYIGKPTPCDLVAEPHMIRRRIRNHFADKRKTT